MISSSFVSREKLVKNGRRKNGTKRSHRAGFTHESHVTHLNRTSVRFLKLRFPQSIEDLLWLVQRRKNVSLTCAACRTSACV